jgi:hypothetical protein
VALAREALLVGSRPEIAVLEEGRCGVVVEASASDQAEPGSRSLRFARKSFPARRAMTAEGPITKT